MYKVIRDFTDADGNMYYYGMYYRNTDSKRLEELSSDKNKYKVPFIELIGGKKDFTEDIKEVKKKTTRKKKVVDTNEWDYTRYYWRIQITFKTWR